ncbi:hypothetical protein ACHAPA_006643 [Fusarium lateritium]
MMRGNFSSIRGILVVLVEAERLVGADESDDERSFNPRDPRANYSLYPLKYLLYCEDCQQIRCSRCVNAKLDGLTVIGSVGNDVKLHFITQELGFDHGFNYK